MKDNDTRPYDCSHPYQQTGLDCLSEHVEMTVRDLAALVAEREGSGGDGIDPHRLDELESEFAQVHVPELVERSYVRYDEERDVVSLLGRGTDARVEVRADRGSTVEVESPDRDSVEVELSEETLDSLHDLMRRRDDLDRFMSYDEVVRTIADAF
ncbi:MAG: hypothetical protein ABEH56_03405 [Salinirussus sp.]